MLKGTQKMRVESLCSLGLKYDGKQFFKDDFNVSWIEVVCDLDGEFKKKVESIKTEMERRKKSHD